MVGRHNTYFPEQKSEKLYFRVSKSRIQWLVLPKMGKISARYCSLPTDFLIYISIFIHHSNLQFLLKPIRELILFPFFIPDLNCTRFRFSTIAWSHMTWQNSFSIWHTYFPSLSTNILPLVRFKK